METQVDDVMELLKGLGSPEQMRALASEGFGFTQPLPANAHIHLPPNFSAFQNVDQAVSLSSQQQIAVLGVSNYYDYRVCDEFGRLAWSKGILPLFGLEVICMQSDLRDAGVKVNDPGNPGKTYLCGKGITRFSDRTPEAERLLSIVRNNDQQRIQEMIARLNACFKAGGLDFGLKEEDVIEMVVRRHGSPRETVYLQERHISQAFEETFHREVPAGESAERISQVLGVESQAEPRDAVALQNEIRSHLMKAGKPAFVDEAFLDFSEAQTMILELGGIPSYPTLADGTNPICGYEADVDQLIETLQDHKIYAAEWIPVRNSPQVAGEYVQKMRAAGLMVTSGTEHNTLDLIPMMPACNDDSLDPALQAIFWEGACVVVAHQFLTAHGECGYVDQNGDLNPAYGSPDERICQLARLGEAVIGKYRESCMMVF